MTQDSAPEQQQDAGEEEWEAREEFYDGTPYDPPSWAIFAKGVRKVAIGLTKTDAATIAADHAVARRARKLEEALRDLQKRIPRVNGAQTRDLERWHQIIAAALLSPATGP